MNYIDKKFNDLMRMLNSMDEISLRNYILCKYQYAPVWYQQNTKAYFERFNYWGQIDLAAENTEYFDMKAHDIIKGLDKINWLYHRLKDYSSKALLYAILENWVNCNTEVLKSTVDTRFRHYFDLDLLPRFRGAVMADLGAYVGDSALDFINTYGVKAYRKIYCYEITEPIFCKLQSNLMPYRNIDCRLKAAGAEAGTVGISPNPTDASSNCTGIGDTVERVTLDDDIKEKISIIKMDIEGDEPNALIGAKNHITNDKPVLLISVYHRNSHLWELPAMIAEFNPNYNYYLRNYGGTVYPTEIVLIAIPKKHKINNKNS